MLLGFGVVKAAFWILHLHPAVKTWELLASQFAVYGLLFGMLVALFRMQYDRPFWRSLGWVATPLPLYSMVTAGVGLAMAVLLLGALIRTPRTENPLTALLKDPTSLILVAIFGTIVAPVCEELVFRGFLQPLLVRSLGAVCRHSGHRPALRHAPFSGVRQLLASRPADFALRRRLRLDAARHRVHQSRGRDALRL